MNRAKTGFCRIFFAFFLRILLKVLSAPKICLSDLCLLSPEREIWEGKEKWVCVCVCVCVCYPLLVVLGNVIFKKNENLTQNCVSVQWPSSTIPPGASLCILPLAFWSSLSFFFFSLSLSLSLLHPPPLHPPPLFHPLFPSIFPVSRKRALSVLWVLSECWAACRKLVSHCGCPGHRNPSAQFFF